MTYKPSDDLKDYLNECAIMSYRLVDGSYVLAEEIDHDRATNILYVAGALALDIRSTGKALLKPWLSSNEDELIELVGDKIVGRTETPFELKMHYHKYFIIEQLRDNLTKNELKTVLEDIFNPPVDKQDLTDDMEEGEEWKIDNGIDDSKKLKKDEGYQSPIDYHLEWRRKHQDNS